MKKLILILLIAAAPFQLIAQEVTKADRVLTANVIIVIVKIGKLT